MIDRLKKIIEGQRTFQRLVDYPIDSIKENDRNEMSEKYIFKMIEEAVELRKEFPSVANPWSKSQKVADLNRVKEELSDVIMFLINIITVWKFTPEEILSTLEDVQKRNFQKVKEKKMALLNSEILRIPGYTTGIGQGNLSPKYIFIGQNPGERITHGYKVWSNPEDGSSKILLPILEKIGILDDCYFTNYVKSSTVGNKEPDETLAQFWKEFLDKELEILLYNNPDAIIIPMGSWTQRAMIINGINHPAYILRGGITKEEYEIEIRKATHTN